MEPITNKNISNRDWSERERKLALSKIALQVDFEESKSAFSRFRFETRVLTQEMLEKGFATAIAVYWRRA